MRQFINAIRYSIHYSIQMSDALIDSLTIGLSELSLGKPKTAPLALIRHRIRKPEVETPPSISATACSRSEVQAHGFSWEKELLTRVYGATIEELQAISYTSKADLPASLNRLDSCDISIKTTCSANAVCMADCLRIFDAVSSGEPLHLVVIQYHQDDERNVKQIQSIVEVDLTLSTVELFGSITRSQLEELDAAVKSVPQKRKPTEDEYKSMYSIRDALQPLSGAIHLDIKCNSTQSRLQCSFNRFQRFLSEFPSRIVAQSQSASFRGGELSAELSSSRRVFKK
jgi:hypothetical protein